METSLSELMKDNTKFQAALAASKEQQAQRESLHDKLQQEERARFEAELFKQREEYDKKLKLLEAENKKLKDQIEDQAVTIQRGTTVYYEQQEKITEKDEQIASLKAMVDEFTAQDLSVSDDDTVSTVSDKADTMRALMVMDADDAMMR